MGRPESASAARFGERCPAGDVAIEAWVPVEVFVFGLRVSMDYEVFLLSRITEARDEGADTNHAVRPACSGPGGRAGLRAFARSLGAASIAVDVWVDHGNLVRRLRISLRPPAGLGARAGARLVQTLDFYDFGIPVRVSAPPAAAVASIAQLAGSGAAGSFVSGIGASARPPRVSGTLSPAQAAAAEHAVRAF